MHNPYWPTKQQKYTENRLKGMSMRKSALEAGYAPCIAQKASERIEPTHQMLIKDALPLVGATNHHVAQAIADALNAKKVIYCDGDAQETEIPEHKTRMDAAKLIAQITGQLDTSTKVAIQINLPADWTEPWGEE